MHLKGGMSADESDTWQWMMCSHFLIMKPTCVWLRLPQNELICFQTGFHLQTKMNVECRAQTGTADKVGLHSQLPQQSLLKGGDKSDDSGGQTINWQMCHHPKSAGVSSCISRSLRCSHPHFFTCLYHLRQVGAERKCWTVVILLTPCKKIDLYTVWHTHNTTPKSRSSWSELNWVHWHHTALICSCFVYWSKQKKKYQLHLAAYFEKLTRRISRHCCTCFWGEL